MIFPQHQKHCQKGNLFANFWCGVTWHNLGGCHQRVVMSYIKKWSNTVVDMRKFAKYIGNSLVSEVFYSTCISIHQMGLIHTFFVDHYLVTISLIVSCFVFYIYLICLPWVWDGTFNANRTLFGISCESCIYPMYYSFHIIWDPMHLIHPGKLTWNPNMEVWFRWFSGFQLGWFLGEPRCFFQGRTHFLLAAYLLVATGVFVSRTW